MARSIKSVQERVKNQQAAKSKGAPQLEFNPPAPPFAPRPTQTPSGQLPPPLRNPNIAMVSAFVGAVVTDYTLCASFIADNGSDSHIVNRFYRDRLTNVRPGNGIQVHHGPDLIPVELVGDAYYDAYDGYGRLNRFTITGVLYVPDFITNRLLPTMYLLNRTPTSSLWGKSPGKL